MTFARRWRSRPIGSGASSARPRKPRGPGRPAEDQNLSPRLVRRLADLFPNSAHVRDVGLASAGDEAVWRHSAAEGYVIVTKDDDFRPRSFLRGPPPKVVWLRLGNCSTADVE